MQFREKLRPGEALERAWFGDIRLIGMYFLGDSSHMGSFPQPRHFFAAAQENEDLRTPCRGPS